MVLVVDTAVVVMFAFLAARRLGRRASTLSQTALSKSKADLPRETVTSKR
jgi:hypothetical protein